MTRWFVAFALVASMVWFAGCSGPGNRPMGTAGGKVTWMGAPVTGGSVVFDNPALGVSQMAELGADGSYTMRNFEGDGLPVGTYKVAIKPGVAATSDAPLATDPSQAALPPPFPVPAEYHSPATSPLSAEVKIGTNAAFDFALPLK